MFLKWFVKSEICEILMWLKNSQLLFFFFSYTIYIIIMHDRFTPHSCYTFFFTCNSNLFKTWKKCVYYFVSVIVVYKNVQYSHFHFTLYCTWKPLRLTHLSILPFASYLILYIHTPYWLLRDRVWDNFACVIFFMSCYLFNHGIDPLWVQDGFD